MTVRAPSPHQPKHNLHSGWKHSSPAQRLEFLAWIKAHAIEFPADQIDLQRAKRIRLLRRKLDQLEDE